jgi:hypothetical protein
MDRFQFGLKPNKNNWQLTRNTAHVSACRTKWALPSSCSSFLRQSILLSKMSLIIEITVIWDVDKCSPTEIDWRLGGAYCHLYSDDPDDGGSIHPETSANFSETTQGNITEEDHLHTRRCENLKLYLSSNIIHVCYSLMRVSKFNTYAKEHVTS